MTRRRKLLFMAPIGIAAILLVGFIGGEIVKLLWNWLLPPIFGWRQITFWQGLGLLALSRILVGGTGRHGCYRSKRLDDMTPEERERFRQRIRDRFGFGRSADVSAPPS